MPTFHLDVENEAQETFDVVLEHPLTMNPTPPQKRVDFLEAVADLLRIEAGRLKEGHGVEL